MEQTFLSQVAVFLTATVISVPLFKRIGLGAVLGYLAAGSVLGPWGLGFVKDPEQTMHFGELGVVLLLFLIGLELRPSRLWNMRYAVFVLGGGQVAITTCLLAWIATHFGLSWMPSVLVGFTLSLSSTAFALQILGERKELNTSFGRASFAVLLFQDLIAIPVLALLPMLATVGTESATVTGFGFFKSIGAILLVILGGRYAIRPFFSLVSQADSREVFLAAALLLVLGVGTFFESIGLSMELGAFLTGVVLSDSEYRHALEADIEPFKGLLLGLFFISVGTFVDYGLIRHHPGLLVLAVVLLVCVKAIVVYFLGRFAKLTPHAARQMALVLPQGGEFAFVVFSVAIAQGLLQEETVRFLIVVVIASMVATPLLGLLDRFLVARVVRPATEPYDSIPDDSTTVIIAGFGRVGQLVARILKLQNIRFTTLEKDPEQVKAVRKFGSKVYYGDASRLDLLEAAGAKTAKYFVLAIDDVETSVKTAGIIRKHFPHLKIFARARNRQHVFELLDHGVEYIWRETFASTMELSKALLMDVGIPLHQADSIVKRFREHDETTLLKQYEIHDDETAFIQYSKQSVQQLLDSVAADQESKGTVKP